MTASTAEPAPVLVLAMPASSSSARDPSISPPPLPLPPKQPPPGPRSHQETAHLIDAYQEKWYSLKRGQLKARHWEEVASSVALRCGFNCPSKTSTQCRHKIEKLRKRYRTERQRAGSVDPSTKWVFFDRLDQMEKGSSTTHRPPPPPPPPDHDSDTTDNETDNNNNMRSLHHLLLEQPDPPASTRPIPPRFVVGKRSSRPPAEPLSELVGVVRSLGEGFLRIEHMKMELLREVERGRMEMEMKRTQMVLESQRHVADLIAKAFVARKKSKSSDK
ncbi:hypothetical protein AMTRI_Chr04g183750 [Amborella trichopoda]